MGEGCACVTKQLRFVDLFAGLGGFHLALSSLGLKCVFASEADVDLADLYQKNFGLPAHGDIRMCWSTLPEHDVLCAGFPCQPFSKAGWQRGMACPDPGDLFEYVLKIIDLRLPCYLLLENVPNLTRHNNGATWQKMRSALERRGYEIDCSLLSPTMFGVPQKRDRAIIVGALRASGGLVDFKWPTPTHRTEELSIESVLDEMPKDAKSLPSAFVHYLEAWQEFLDRVPSDSPLPSFPIWAMEFGATYPFEGDAPATRSSRDLSCYTGQFGASLRGISREKQISNLPPYARQGLTAFPAWKKKFIRDNRAFYNLHKTHLSSWLPQIRDFAPSFQKFEWNWKEGNRSLWDKIIQFRASGIRVKRPNVAPSLVALTTSQVPVIPWEKRYMTMRECARLQSMGSLNLLPSSKTRTHKALGNAVNVTVVMAVAKELLGANVETATRGRQGMPSQDGSGTHQPSDISIAV